MLTVFIGNVLTLIPMCLNAHPGTKYGVSTADMVHSDSVQCWARTGKYCCTGCCCHSAVSYVVAVAVESFNVMHSK